MFKVQDNPDGSTSVYCKSTGSLLCNIPGKQNSNTPRPVNVVKPQPASTSSWCQEEKKPKLCDPVTVIEVQDDSKSSGGDPPPAADEDYFDDCLTQDSFARCLDLVSSEQLRREPRARLLAEYPLRLLSRSRAFRTLERHPTEDLRDIKTPDDMPLTSRLGIKVLELNRARNFLEPGKPALGSIKLYDSFCRHPFRGASGADVHFPKLRCRQKKQYPVTATAKVLRTEMAHWYTRGRRQREERTHTLRTGLTARSRRLLAHCQKKQCRVRLWRLTKEEIDAWAPTDPPSPPPEEEKPLQRRPASPDRDWRPRAAAPAPACSDRVTRRRGARVCQVRLRDVMLDARQRAGSGGGCYVRGVRVAGPATPPHRPSNPPFGFTCFLCASPPLLRPRTAPPTPPSDSRASCAPSAASSSATTRAAWTTRCGRTCAWCTTSPNRTPTSSVTWTLTAAARSSRRFPRTGDAETPRRAFRLLLEMVALSFLVFCAGVCSDGSLKNLHSSENVILRSMYSGSP